MKKKNSILDLREISKKRDDWLLFKYYCNLMDFIIFIRKGFIYPIEYSLYFFNAPE